MEKLRVTSPNDDSVLEELSWNKFDEIESWLLNAQQVHQSNAYPISLDERLNILQAIQKAVESEKEAFAILATKEGGKPIQDSRIEIARAIEGIGLAITYSKDIKDQAVPMNLNTASKGKQAFIRKIPIGIVVAISAFNHPLNLIVHQVIPAIAKGCPVIVKPALTTPLTCLKFIELIQKVGIPESVCKVAITKDEDSEKLATSSVVNYVSFIGSQKVGWYLRSKVAAGTRIGLEHGGTAPVVLHESFNLEKALPGLIKGGYYHAGQVCVSVQKIYIPKSRTQEFTKRFVEEVEKLKTGNPLNEDTQVGPLISTKEVDRVHSWVEEAVLDEGQLLLGGHKINDHYYEPTVLLSPPKISQVSRNEIFGPVVCLYEYENIEEVIGEINGSDYHFQAAVYGEQMRDVENIVTQIHAATVLVNEHTAFRVDWMPFGGQKKSGLGLSGIPYTLEEYSESKLVIYNRDH